MSLRPHGSPGLPCVAVVPEGGLPRLLLSCSPTIVPATILEASLRETTEGFSLFDSKRIGTQYADSTCYLLFACLSACSACTKRMAHHKPQIMKCRQLGRVFRDTVEASLSVLALSGVNTLTWATPENLAFLTRFKNVRTLHW